NSGLAPTSQLRKASSLWVPPPRPKPQRVDYDSLTDSGDIGALAKHIIRQGPNGDRSTFLVHVAHAIKEHGAPPALAESTIRDLDRTLGKFKDRSDADERYRDIVDEAYSR